MLGSNGPMRPRLSGKVIDLSGMMLMYVKCGEE